MVVNGFNGFGPPRSPPPPPPSPPSIPALTSSSSGSSNSPSPINRNGSSNSNSNNINGTITTFSRRLVIHPEIRIGSIRHSYPEDHPTDPMDGVYLRPSNDPWGLYGDPRNIVDPFPLPTWDNPDADEDEGGGWVTYETNPPEGEGEFDLQVEAEVMNAEYAIERNALARGEEVHGRKEWAYGTRYALKDWKYQATGVGGSSRKSRYTFGGGGRETNPILRLRGPKKPEDNHLSSEYYRGVGNLNQVYDRTMENWHGHGHGHGLGYKPCRHDEFGGADGDVEMEDVITVKPRAALQYSLRSGKKSNEKKAEEKKKPGIQWEEVEDFDMEIRTSTTEDGGDDEEDDDDLYTPPGTAKKNANNSNNKNNNKGRSGNNNNNNNNKSGNMKRRRHSSYEMKLEARQGVDEWAKTAKKSGRAKAAAQGPYGPRSPVKAPNFYGPRSSGTGGSSGKSSMRSSPPKYDPNWRRGSRVVRSDDEGSTTAKYYNNKRAKQSDDDGGDEGEGSLDMVEHLKLRQIEIEAKEAEREKRLAAMEARKNKGKATNKAKEIEDDHKEQGGKKSGLMGMKKKDRMGGKPNTASAGGGKAKHWRPGKENMTKGNDGQDDDKDGEEEDKHEDMEKFD